MAAAGPSVPATRLVTRGPAIVLGWVCHYGRIFRALCNATARRYCWKMLPRGALLAPGVALVMLGGEYGTARHSGVICDGQALAPPFGTLAFGPAGQIAAFRLPPVSLEPNGPPLLLPGPRGEYVPLFARSLDGDPLTLAADLGAADRARLLRFLLGFCCPGFKLGRSAQFSAICTRLARDTLCCSGTANVLASVLPGYVLVEGVNPSQSAMLAVLGKGSVEQARLLVLEGPGGLQVLPQVGAGDLIIGGGSDPVYWIADVPAETLPSVLSLPEPAGSAARSACCRALRGPEIRGVAQFMRHMDLLFPEPQRRMDDPAQPIAGAVELAIPDEQGGLFLSGWLRDPLDLITAVSVATLSGDVPLTPDVFARFPRPDLASHFAKAAHRGAGALRGFVAHLTSVPGPLRLNPTLCSICAPEHKFILFHLRDPSTSVRLVMPCSAPLHRDS